MLEAFLWDRKPKERLGLGFQGRRGFLAVLGNHVQGCIVRMQVCEQLQL